MKAPKGFTTLTVAFDVTASRKSDRVWKLTVPVSESTVEKVRLPVPIPEGRTWEGDEAEALAPALKAATTLVEALGLTPEWEIKTNPMTGFPMATARIEADDAA